MLKGFLLHLTKRRILKTFRTMFNKRKAEALICPERQGLIMEYQMERLKPLLIQGLKEYKPNVEPTRTQVKMWILENVIEEQENNRHENAQAWSKIYMLIKHFELVEEGR